MHEAIQKIKVASFFMDDGVYITVQDDAIYQIDVIMK